MKKISGNTKSILQNAPLDVLLGRAAMLGFVLAFGAYLATDAVAPGLV